MDRQDLAKMCDARDIVKMMHIPYQNNQNGTLKILCPGHEERLGKKDAHIGNCVVYQTGYKCYAYQRPCLVFNFTHNVIKGIAREMIQLPRKKKSTMVKNYLLDTSILLQNPDSVFQFDDNNIWICGTTLQELDGKKTARESSGITQGKLGKN